MGVLMADPASVFMVGMVSSHFGNLPDWLYDRIRSENARNGNFHVREP